METRKIQFTGGSTYTISLPKEWANDNGVEAGSMVYLFPKAEGSLVVRTEQKEEPREVRASVDGLDDTALREVIRALYSSGAEKIVLDAATEFDDAQRRTVTRVVANLIGFEVFEETRTQLVLCNLISGSNVSLGQAVSQLQSVTISMYEDAIRYVQGDIADPDHVLEREREVRRLHSLIKRHFQRAFTSEQALTELDIDRQTASDYHDAATQMHRISCSAGRLARTADSLDDPSPEFERAIDLTGRSVDLVRDATSALLDDRNVGEAAEVVTVIDDVEADLADVRRTVYGAGTDADCRTVLVLERTADVLECCRTIVEAAVRTCRREETGLTSNSLQGSKSTALD